MCSNLEKWARGRKKKESHEEDFEIQRMQKEKKIKVGKILQGTAMGVKVERLASRKRFFIVCLDVVSHKEWVWEVVIIHTPTISI